MRIKLPRTFRLMFVLPAAAAALLSLPVSTADSGPPAGSGPLDGMVFSGYIGAADDPDIADQVYFDDGQFWSAGCVRCGFEPGFYWVRHTDDGIAFRGVLRSADRGTFNYKGMVRGTKIDVLINWRHERWYWTINRDLRFVGELQNDGVAGMTIEQAYALAGGKEALPDNCPS